MRKWAQRAGLSSLCAVFLFTSITQSIPVLAEGTGQGEGAPGMGNSSPGSGTDQPLNPGGLVGRSQSTSAAPPLDNPSSKSAVPVKKKKKLSPEQEVEKNIPKNPSAPPAIGRETGVEIYHCQRQFLYKGKVLNCDSALHWDGENLRPLLFDSPAALAELDAYQANRAKVKSLAYLTTFGAILALVGQLVIYPKLDPPKSYAYRNMTVIPGIAMFVGGFAYGLILLNTNETHLGNAVEIYNQSNPTNQIELRFSTGINL